MLLYYIIGWALSGVIGYMIGSSKGEEGFGLLMGLLLGPIGWLIVGLSSGDRVVCPFCREKIDPLAIVCPRCQRDQPAKVAVADMGPVPETPGSAARFWIGIGALVAVTVLVMMFADMYHK